MALILCNGQPASAEVLAAAALVNYGHFTTLQLRQGRARGLDMHLQRLQHGTEALFGVGLDPLRVRRDLHAGLNAFGSGDASVRITVFARDFDFRDPLRALEPDLLVSLGPPSEASGQALRVRSVAFVRDTPRLKHVGTFPLFQQRRQAMADGFDDALFVDPAGLIVEGSVWNLGLWDAAGVTWPQGPALRGTQQRLLQAGLAALGVAQQVRPVGLAELGGFEGAFICNSRGQQPLASIDGRVFVPRPHALELLARALETQPWQAL